MIDYETFCKIRDLHDRDGLKCSQIAEKLGMDSRTVQKWLDEKNYRSRGSTPQDTIITPFKQDAGKASLYRNADISAVAGTGL